MFQSEVRTIDYHTGGEPFRIVAQPLVPIPGARVAERRMFALADPQVDFADGQVDRSPCAHKTGEHLFVVDPADDLIPGFVLR